MMKRVERVAVLGSGVMGSAIAAHLANAGLEVLLLDIVPDSLTEDEKDKGLTLGDTAVRNRYATSGLNRAKNSKPASFFTKERAKLISVGNFDDDIEKISECDWVIEAVLENMEIKQKLFRDKVVPNLGTKAILSTNTSGLSVNEMSKALPDDVKKRFMVTHFFNPPRYMRLLEIIPATDTDLDLIRKMAGFIEKRLGKGVVYAKDTPNFVANRIGLYAIYSAIKYMLEMGLTVEEVDAVSGVASARPKSAVFRTADLVGVDLLTRVGDNSYEALVNDEERELFIVPGFLREMADKGRIGEKANEGFYKKEKVEGVSKISYLDYKTGEYLPSVRPKFPSVLNVKLIDDPAQRLKTLLIGKDKAAEFIWKNLRDTLLYTVRRIPEIADDIVNVDNAMRWGFNWEIGPFEMLDAIGVEEFVKRAEADGFAAPEALKSVDRFYKIEEGRKQFFDLVNGEYRNLPVESGAIDITILKTTGGEVEKNSAASVIDIGDGVFLFEFHSKMNAIGADTISIAKKAIGKAEKDGVALIVGNDGALFSAGANLMTIAVAIAEGAYDDINMVVRAFQNATMGLKYAKVPVVAAPFGLTLGGGAEFTLSCDAVNAFAETYMGLVEIGVGLLPSGGGTKEMAIRAVDLADAYNTDSAPFVFKFFQQIGLGKVSMSAEELFDMGYLRRGDTITLNRARLISDAKQKALSMAVNYRPLFPRDDIKAPGRSVAASMKSQLWNMRMGGYATEYEETIGGIIADVITGGDVPGGTVITEQRLLDLEREAFLKLCGNKKTLERIQHMLKKGKPLRN